MSEQPFVKCAVDLFMDDVANCLKDAKAINPGQMYCSINNHDRLWHAVLYLSRAVRSMHDDNVRSPLLAAHATGLQDRISLALAHLKSRQIDIQEVVRILEGG